MTWRPEVGLAHYLFLFAYSGVQHILCGVCFCFVFVVFVLWLVCSLFVCLMVLNATFNNISVISWRSISYVEETGGSGKNTNLSQVTDKLYHIMLYTSPWSRFELTTSVVIETDCVGRCKSNGTTATCLVRLMLPVSLECPFVIATSVF